MTDPSNKVPDYFATLTADIDLNARWDVLDMDACVNKCIYAATECLRSIPPGFSDYQRFHLHQVFLSMRHTHQAIRELLCSEQHRPLAVNAMSLTRVQVETLYAISLIVEKPEFLELYLKDGWKKRFVGHLIMRKECSQLPRVVQDLDTTEKWLERMRLEARVSEIEKQTIEAKVLGCAPPKDGQDIPMFPTPGRLRRKIIDTARKKMLNRLYPEYEFLCGFVHFSPVTAQLTSLFDKRQPFQQYFSSGQIEEIYQKEIVGPALWYDVLAVVQSCTELIELFPADVELARRCVEAWRQLSTNTLIGQVVWSIRTKSLLNIVGET